MRNMDSYETIQEGDLWVSDNKGSFPRKVKYLN